MRLRFDDFEWRPYTKPLKNWNPLQVYIEEDKWVTGDKFASFARCVRVSQLAGDGFIERYYPNRMKRQFGLAQDLPDYNKSLEGFKLYMPSRLARGYVTVRYRDWWVKSVSELMRCEEMHKEQLKL